MVAAPDLLGVGISMHPGPFPQNQSTGSYVVIDPMMPGILASGWEGLRARPPASAVRTTGGQQAMSTAQRARMSASNVGARKPPTDPLAMAGVRGRMRALEAPAGSQSKHNEPTGFAARKESGLRYVCICSRRGWLKSAPVSGASLEGPVVQTQF